MPRDEGTLCDIAVAGKLIGQFIADMDKSSFMADVKTQLAYFTNC